ncbi:MAG: translesion error-prone DNA polymerase V autoproteolytic subunit [Paludibacter sp.]|nr:translesion error-prone DNA polymerase V autoproteolytic subunit [Paludibacter sp.]
MSKKMQPTKTLEIYPVENASTIRNEYIGDLKAGFPSPASDFLNESIDLNKYVTTHPTATYYARANGISMEGDFNDGDLLVIDRSLDFTEGKIVVCFIDGEFTVKRIKKDAEGVWLMPSSERFKPILVTAENDLRIWGVVTHVIKKV